MWIRPIHGAMVIPQSGRTRPALHHKQQFATRTGIQVHIVTQFGFDPEGVCVWDQRMTEQGITLPVHVGIAGPTSLAKLIKFALQCGVGASMSSLVKNVGSMANLTRLATAPDEMLLSLIRGRATYSGSRLVQPHFYMGENCLRQFSRNWGGGFVWGRPKSAVFGR